MVRVREAPNAWVRRVLRVLYLSTHAELFEVQVMTRQGPRTVALRNGEYFALATRSKLLHDYSLFGLDCWCHALELSCDDVLLEVEDLDALIARADERYEASDFAAAAELLERAAGLGVLLAVDYERLAIACCELDLRERSLSMFEMAKLRDPSDLTIRRNLAHAHRRWGQVADAAAELIVAAAIEGTPDALLEFADDCLDDDDLHGAELGYRAALAMRPKDAQLQWVLANVLDDSDKADEAAPLYERALASMRPTAALEYDIGVHLSRRGEHERAEGHLERALDLQPGYQDAMLSLATLRAELGRHDEAIAMLEALQGTNPDDDDITDLLRALREEQP